MMAPVDDQTTPSPWRTGATSAPGWAVPGSAPEQPTPGPEAAGPGAAPGQPPAPGAGSGSPAPQGAPDDGRAGVAAVPQVALRPMTIADILDGGFAVVKARPRRILAIAAAFVVPTHLLAACLQREAMGAYPFGVYFTEDPTVVNEQSSGVSAGPLFGGMLLGVIPAIALVCVAAAIAHLVTQWTMGRDSPGREMLGVLGRRWWPLLASFVLVKLAEMLGVFGCYIGIVFVMALF